MVVLIKVRKDSHNIAKLLLLLELPELPTSFSFYYPFIFSLWAQGKWAAEPTRLLSAHIWYAALQTLPVSSSGAALDMLAGRGDEPPPWCAKETGGPSCQEQSLLEATTQDTSCDPTWSHHSRGSTTLGEMFSFVPLAQWKTLFTAREKCRVQRSTTTLGTYPKYASRVLPVRAIWAPEAAKTSLCCINREINVLKCLLSQQ